MFRGIEEGDKIGCDGFSKSLHVINTLPSNLLQYFMNPSIQYVSSANNKFFQNHQPSWKFQNLWLTIDFKRNWAQMHLFEDVKIPIVAIWIMHIHLARRSLDLNNLCKKRTTRLSRHRWETTFNANIQYNHSFRIQLWRNVSARSVSFFFLPVCLCNLAHATLTYLFVWIHHSPRH